MRFAAVLFLALLLLPAVAIAGPLEDGKAAYDRKDYQTALKLLQPLADQGNAEAQFDMGLLYFGGLGVKKDTTEGVNWTRKAADQGNIPAEMKMGKLYRVNTGDAFTGGAFVLKAHDDVVAMKWYRKAADQGSAEAEYQVGSFYWVGSAEVPKDEKEAILWYRKSAEHGFAGAQVILGQYYRGAFNRENYGVADTTVKPNYPEALKWLLLAADQNDPWAPIYLALMYKNGEGVKQDYVQAYMWANMYADTQWGRTDETFNDKLTLDQRKDAIRLIADWRAKHSRPPAPAEATGKPETK